MVTYFLNIYLLKMLKETNPTLKMKKKTLSKYLNK
jgi:uncharacterized protein YoxC